MSGPVISVDGIRPDLSHISELQFNWLKAKLGVSARLPDDLSVMSFEIFEGSMESIHPF